MFYFADDSYKEISTNYNFLTLYSGTTCYICVETSDLSELVDSLSSGSLSHIFGNTETYTSDKEELYKAV